MNNRIILVTGASGFVGRQLYDRLKFEGHHARCAVRCQSLQKNQVVIGNIGPETSWHKALQGVDTVVHLAARIHPMNNGSNDPLVEYRRINVTGTLNLARQSIASGVKRFIFLSSVKVNGEVSLTGQPLTELHPPHPENPYAVSKYEAEEGLRQLAEKTGLEVVIIRSPLVYGCGVKGNVQSLIRWIGKRVPLPFGAVQNHRSLVGIDNLVDFIIVCTDHPAAKNQLFFVADGEDLSTPELVCRIGKALGVSSCLIPIPVRALKIIANLLGKQATAQRLFDSLQVDISKARNMLGWTPPFSVDEGLERMVSGDS